MTPKQLFLPIITTSNKEAKDAKLARAKATDELQSDMAMSYNRCRMLARAAQLARAIVLGKNRSQVENTPDCEYNCASIALLSDVANLLVNLGFVRPTHDALAEWYTKPTLYPQNLIISRTGK